MWGLAFKVVDKVTLPEPLLRLGVRHFCQNRLNSLVSRGDGTFSEQVSGNIRNYARELRTLPLAVSTDLANEQHYEVPASFFDLVLGPNKKYSCCYWDKSTKRLGEAEELALDITIKRAELKDGQRILELGCGWGSLSLKMAKTFPRAKIVGVSNSIEQREYILKKAQSLGIKNLEIKTLDLSQVTSLEELVGTVDRVVSIEMFEHFRNYEKLLGLIRGALAQGGKLFVHVFAHAKHPYLFEVKDQSDWMTRYFFSGGQMPSFDLFREFEGDLKLTQSWWWNGEHYGKTSDAWLKNLNSNSNAILELFKVSYGEKDAQTWFNRWRLFFIAVSETFAFRRGEEWGVGHYLFERSS